MTDQRNAFGHPAIELRLERAKQYVAQKNARHAPCICDRCKRLEDLEKVMRVTNNWEMK